MAFLVTPLVTPSIDIVPVDQVVVGLQCCRPNSAITTTRDSVSVDLILTIDDFDRIDTASGLIFEFV